MVFYCIYENKDCMKRGYNARQIGKFVLFISVCKHTKYSL